MIQPREIEPLMTVPELMAALGVSRSFAYKLVASGRIPSIRIGRLVRVPVARAQALIDEQLTAAHRGTEAVTPGKDVTTAR